MKKIYIAATEQNDGKTTLAIGLFCAAKERGIKAAFIKPIGQRYVEENGKNADEDAVLFKNALGVNGEIAAISPVTIPRGFTQEYIFNRDPGRIIESIKEAFTEISKGHELVIIEGTGHAGVGSVLDASNARVAKELGADCILTSKGGVGRCIDALALNKALFNCEGVECIGAVINKVYKEKYDKLKPVLKQGLQNIGLSCLGVVPYTRELTYPQVGLVKKNLNLDVLSGEECFGNLVKSTIVAAMEPENMVEYIKQGTLVIVPGDRVDNIITAINAHLMDVETAANSKISGMILTGGLIPQKAIVSLLSRVHVPVLLSSDDTATTSNKLDNLTVKLGPEDQEKLATTRELIEGNVNVDIILDTYHYRAQ